MCYNLLCPNPCASCAPQFQLVVAEKCPQATYHSSNFKGTLGNIKSLCRFIRVLKDASASFCVTVAGNDLKIEMHLMFSLCCLGKSLADTKKYHKYVE